MNLILPKCYKPILGVKETERAIKSLKDFFELNLATELNLSRVTAPLFVQAGTGINDDLNGLERPVSFAVKALPNVRAEIVQSLAKWKRLQLAELGFEPGYGLYTDMNAIRPDEVLDNTHSLYVDQWDWERVITPAEPGALIRCGKQGVDFSAREKVDQGTGEALTGDGEHPLDLC